VTELREVEILERTVRHLAELADDALQVVTKARTAGLGTRELVMQPAKALRTEPLDIKRDLEREISRVIFNCARCGLEVHWVPGWGPEPGHWAHAEPAPDHEVILRARR
jgi:hypothetical protein